MVKPAQFWGWKHPWSTRQLSSPVLVEGVLGHPLHHVGACCAKEDGDEEERGKGGECEEEMALLHCVQSHLH